MKTTYVFVPQTQEVVSNWPGYLALVSPQAQAVIDRIPTMAKEANQGCGLVYELYCVRLSQMIDAAAKSLSEKDRAAVITEAQKYGDYCGPNDRDLSSDELCEHGLPYECCPCGCGEVNRRTGTIEVEDNITVPNFYDEFEEEETPTEEIDPVSKPCSFEEALDLYINLSTAHGHYKISLAANQFYFKNNFEIDENSPLYEEFFNKKEWQDYSAEMYPLCNDFLSDEVSDYECNGERIGYSGSEALCDSFFRQPKQQRLAKFNVQFC